MSTVPEQGSSRNTSNDIATSTEQIALDAGAAADQVKRDASAAVDTAMHDLGDVANEAQQQFAGIADEAKQQLNTATEQAKGFANQQKDLLTSQLDGVAGALGKVADELGEKDQTTAGYVRAVADKAQAFTSSVKDKNIDELLTMAQDFGRKQPVAFVGIAALLGFAASRFLMASAHGAHAQTNTQSQGQQQPLRYGSATPVVHEPWMGSEDGDSTNASRVPS